MLYLRDNRESRPGCYKRDCGCRFSILRLGQLRRGRSQVLGYMNGSWKDVHGAGAQRSDPKSGDPDDYTAGHGPQGDVIRIYNYVRLVRDKDLAADFIVIEK